MIKEISFNYRGQFPKRYGYIKDGRLLPKRVEFTEGLNIVIGENGCGKSSLLNVIRALTLTGGLRLDVSMWDQVGVFFPKEKDFLSQDYDVVQDGVTIVNDYDAPVMPMDKLESRRSFDGSYECVEDFAQHFDEAKMSKGQKMLNTIRASIRRANRYMESYSLAGLFPSGPMNSTFREGVDKVREHVESITCGDLPKRGVFLMDEPDEGLDIRNLAVLKNFLLEAGKTVQVIAVIHNPLLIRTLADKANVIELTEGYLEDVKNF
jgi:ATPase subunit of ABC transporter with duplicated ATPase domains